MKPELNRIASQECLSYSVFFLFSLYLCPFHGNTGTRLCMYVDETTWKSLQTAHSIALPIIYIFRTKIKLRSHGHYLHSWPLRFGLGRIWCFHSQAQERMRLPTIDVIMNVVLGQWDILAFCLKRVQSGQKRSAKAHESQTKSAHMHTSKHTFMKFVSLLIPWWVAPCVYCWFLWNRYNLFLYGARVTKIFAQKSMAPNKTLNVAKHRKYYMCETGWFLTVREWLCISRICQKKTTHTQELIECLCIFGWAERKWRDMLLYNIFTWH